MLNCGMDAASDTISCFSRMNLLTTSPTDLLNVSSGALIEHMEFNFLLVTLKEIKK